MGIGESCSILTPRGNHKSLCVTQAFSNLFKASSLFPAHLNQSKPPPSSPAAKDWSVGKKRASASKLSKKKASKVFFPIPIFLPERRQEGELMALHRASALLFHAGVHFCVHQPLCALTFVCTVQLCTHFCAPTNFCAPICPVPAVHPTPPICPPLQENCSGLHC